MFQISDLTFVAYEFMIVFLHSEEMGKIDLDG